MNEVYRCPICDLPLLKKTKEDLLPDTELFALVYGYALTCDNGHGLAFNTLGKMDEGFAFQLLFDAWKLKLKRGKMKNLLLHLVSLSIAGFLLYVSFSLSLLPWL